jgi:hypothetical protein
VLPSVLYAEIREGDEIINNAALVIDKKESSNTYLYSGSIQLPKRSNIYTLYITQTYVIQDKDNEQSVHFRNLESTRGPRIQVEPQ